MSHRTRGTAIDAIEKRHEALLILDVDEVVLEFIAPFQTLLGEHGAALRFDSYKLTGNAMRVSSGIALSGGELETIMLQLYAEQAKRQLPVNGVREALDELGQHADIVFLTAMDPDYHDTRRAVLDAAGLSYPMIATERAKGGVVAELQARWSGPIVFVDDLPPNLQTVRRSAPTVHLVHLMAHDGFRPHLPALPSGTLSARDWPHARNLIGSILRDGSDADGLGPTG
ncbi:hypothetical protein DYI37_05315 [Fulvimarina endophytica]|uniref:HAD family hydrolase n=1 Tax=Fulvimarina endophytica TaxID=2293836 RepID=A0A371X7R5_9HYPH|nr:hypothetical protein [Fulvimarina endophytica]RFC65260.1 hypothetical protein DYI37_05315 [Fulvimarina endophytica]